MQGVFHIDQVWAFICTDADGTEGIPAFNDGLMMIPMIAADEQKVRALRKALDRPELRQALKGKRIVLTQFTTRRDVEVVQGGTGDPS